MTSRHWPALKLIYSPIGLRQLDPEVPVPHPDGHINIDKFHEADVWILLISLLTHVQNICRLQIDLKAHSVGLSLNWIRASFFLQQGLFEEIPAARFLVLSIFTRFKIVNQPNETMKKSVSGASRYSV